MICLGGRSEDSIKSCAFYCSSEGCIETDLVYPVLLRSNLPNEVLGCIWELCNKTTPGRLIQEELFLILAMISIAQVFIL